MASPVTLRVFRWTAGEAEGLAEYRVAVAADTTVLDALIVSGFSHERREIDQAIECIGCGMCVSACTIAGHNERSPGPAALNRVLTLELDQRDAAGTARWRVFLDDDAFARCHGQSKRTEVRPMGLSPADSIRRLRRLVLSRLLGLSR